MKKVLLLFPKNYTLLNNFFNIFVNSGYKTENVDFNDFFSATEKKINQKLLRLPWKIKWQTLEKINRKVNQKYIEKFEDYKPDLVFIYNEQKLLRETVVYFNRKAKTAFFLGDHPLFIKNRPDNLAAILEGNHIFCPDSYWMEQLKIMGVKNVSFLLPGYSKELNYPKILTPEQQGKYGSDIAFIGRQYHDTWGYKRALFLNLFSGMNMKIYGNRVWEKWFRYFPELKQHFVLNENYLPFETVNIILNASKIYPVDANAGLINGLHTRIFEAIGSGILPLVEYRKDLKTVFEGIDIPIVYSYTNAKTLAIKYINDDEARTTLIQKLKNYIDQKYSDSEVAKQIFSQL